MAEERLDWNSGEQQPKLLHAGETWTSEPYIWIAEDRLVLSAGAGNQAESLEEGISIDPQFGTHIQGRLSISGMPQQVSMCGGYFRLNPLLLASIGSSAALNIPTLVWDEPELMKSQSDFEGLAGAIGV